MKKIVNILSKIIYKCTCILGAIIVVNELFIFWFKIPYTCLYTYLLGCAYTALLASYPYVLTGTIAGFSVFELNTWQYCRYRSHQHQRQNQCFIHHPIKQVLWNILMILLVKNGKIENLENMPMEYIFIGLKTSVYWIAKYFLKVKYMSLNLSNIN